VNLGVTLTAESVPDSSFVLNRVWTKIAAARVGLVMVNVVLVTAMSLITAKLAVAFASAKTTAATVKRGHWKGSATSRIHLRSCL